MKGLLAVLKYSFVALVISTVVGTAIGATLILFFSKGLPNIITVKDYKPLVVSRVLGKNDVVVGEYFEEKRYVIPPEKIPDLVARAFVSAEDDRFFQHQGIDLQGILRAAITNFKAGKVVQGGSTITQQVAKSLLLTPERSFVRKFKEIILANRMEKNLSKNEILYLYLNQIYLGQGAYGIEAASQTYFHKEAKDLQISEAAILAGLPQAPSKYSPLLNPKKAKERQLYVLRRMHEDGVITETQMVQATKEQVKIYIQEDLNLKYSPYYIEELRKYLINKYGKENLYGGGLIIKTPLDSTVAKHATKSVQEGLRVVDKKQGYRGPIKKAKNQQEFEEISAEILVHNIQKKYPYSVLQTDGTLASEFAVRSDKTANLDLVDENEIYKAIVSKVDDAKKEVEINLGVTKGIIPLDKMRWAQRVKEPSSNGIVEIIKPSQALEKGDVIWARLISKKSEKYSLPVLSLEQIPILQGALLSMDVNTGEVLAMVGGYDFALSEYNRAIQAQRQPGSAYKPIIYSAAVDKGYTPATIIQDSPIVFDAGENLKWKPENYEEKFYGDTTFRLSLIKSRNIPTIKIVQDIELPYLIDYTKHIGINANLPTDYSIALGSFSVTVLDLVQTYAIYPRGGRKIKPVFLYKVIDREGKTLEETTLTQAAPNLSLNLLPPPPAVKVCGELLVEKKNQKNSEKDGAVATDEIKRGTLFSDPSDQDRVLDPRTSFVMTHLMNEVATIGTGAEAKTLGRPAAGKTGTTNDNIDAWFMGFTPYIVTGVWVGFDTQKTIAPKATGAMVSLPIWIEYMKEAVKSYPDSDFNVPKGVTFATIDGKTGKRALPKSPDSVLEAFVEGTEPNSQASYKAQQSPANVQKQNEADSENDDFYKQDIK